MRRAFLLRSLGGALALASWSSDALAQEPAWLEWQAPPECPSATHIAQNLEGWLKRPLGPDEAQVTAAVRSTDGGWEVTVLVVRGELRGERSVRTRTCVEAADFVALSVALAIDPGVSEGISVSDTSDPSAPPRASAEPERSEPAPVPATEPSTSESPAAPEASQPPRDTARDQKPAEAISWRAQAGASFDFFTLPSARLGVSAHLGWSFARAFALLGAEWLPPATETVPNAQSDVDFSRLTGELRVGYAFTKNDVELAPYVEGQLGQIFAASPQYSRKVLWLGAGAGGQMTWLPTQWLQPYSSLGVLVPLERSTFVLSGGTKVHEVPAVSFEAGVGIRTIF